MASLQSRLGSLITAIGADIKSLKAGGFNRPAVTTLPSSAQADGAEFYYRVAEGIVWHLRYNAASLSNFKYEFVGGPTLSHILNEGGTTRTTAGVQQKNYSDLSANAAGDGPRVVVPLIGEYEIEYGYAAGWNTVNGAYAFMSLMLGPDDPGTNLTAEMDSRRIENHQPNANSPQSGSSVITTQLNNGDQVYCRYATSGSGLASFRYTRYLRVRPIRVRPTVILA